MAGEDRIVSDDHNPEWTEADFVRARPADEVLPQAFMAAFRAQRPASAMPEAAVDAPKQRVTHQLDRDVINTVPRNAKWPVALAA